MIILFNIFCHITRKISPHIFSKSAKTKVICNEHHVKICKIRFNIILPLLYEKHGLYCNCKGVRIIFPQLYVPVFYFSLIFANVFYYRKSFINIIFMRQVFKMSMYDMPILMCNGKVDHIEK